MQFVQRQIRRLHASSMLGSLSLTGAWVAILAARGFTLVEIGLVETVFHITSLIFEIPSGILADALGRKKMLLVSCLAQMAGCLVMIASRGLGMVCLSIAFIALSYNFSSGSGDALAYDTLQSGGQEAQFERYESNQFIIWRLCSGLSTLCAGFALQIGYRAAYGTGLITGAAQLAVLMTLQEPACSRASRPGSLRQRLLHCTRESLSFLRSARRAWGLMLCNSLVGALDVLLLFFLQAKLPEKGVGWALGLALLAMESGGIVGSRLIVRLPRLKYRHVAAITGALVLTGVLLEHAASCWVMTLGGFLASMGDDALQVRTNARLQDMFPSGQRATLTSVSSFTFSMVMIVLSPLAGWFFTIW